MKKLLYVSCMFTTIAGAQAWGAPQLLPGQTLLAAGTTDTITNTTNQPREAAAYESDSSSTTSITHDEPNTTGLNNSRVGVTPQFGLISFRNEDGSGLSRGVLGLTVDVNGTGFVNQVFGRGYTDIYSGITLGMLYSHLGSPSSNFFGSSEGTFGSGFGGANLVVLPLNGKVGYSFGNFLLAGHGGVNAFYRSIASAVRLGTTASNSSDSDWSVLPNVGLDLQYGVTNQIAVQLRPDWTFAGSNPAFSATLGATMPI